MGEYYVYILTNASNVLYIGMTKNLAGRFWEHTDARMPGFASKYNLNRLVFFEVYPPPREAIAREKQLKGWRREKKIALIEAMNPGWRDLSGRFQE